MEYWSTKYEFTSCIRKYLYLQLYFETKEVSELKYFHRASPFSASKASGSSSPSKKTQLQRTIYLPMYQVVVCRYLFITRPLTCKKVYWKSFFNVGNINPLFMVNHYLESLSGENSFNLLSYIGFLRIYLHHCKKHQYHLIRATFHSQIWFQLHQLVM